MELIQKNLLTARDLAKALRVPAKWLRSEADAGKLPHVKAARAYLFDRSTVEAFLCERAKLEGLREPEGGSHEASTQ